MEEPAIALPTHILDQQNMPEREPFLSPPSTPKTLQSLQILGEASLASITSSSPSSRLQRQCITKLLHAAQFSLARNTLLTKIQEEQLEEEQKTGKRQENGFLGRKRIPDHGQAFATMADLQVRRQQLLVGERKRVQKQVEGLKRKKNNLEARVSEAKRKMEKKRNNPCSRIKKSVESWGSDLQDLGEKYASLGSKLEAAQV